MAFAAIAFGSVTGRRDLKGIPGALSLTDGVSFGANQFVAVSRTICTAGTGITVVSGHIDAMFTISTGITENATTLKLAGFTNKDLSSGAGWTLTILLNGNMGTARSARIVIGDAINAADRI
jgi:hypothetical protein